MIIFDIYVIVIFFISDIVNMLILLVILSIFIWYSFSYLSADSF
jgi:hypothetical protein